MSIDLRRLAEPFPAEDIEWRVSRAGNGQKGIFCMVLAYLTARAIQSRLDEVCGPENWRNELPQVHDIHSKFSFFVVGISIRVNNEWMTKWDVSEPTNIEPAKGGFSGGMKRAGAQWGIGRYLYHLDETFAEVSESSNKGWNYAKIKDGGATYYWKRPTLPAWALPKEKQHEISDAELKALKSDWRLKCAPDTKNPADLRDGFTRFVVSTVGEFPLADFTCWTRDALERVAAKIQTAGSGGGVSGDVPFDK
jgi:hypothetical protein